MPTIDPVSYLPALRRAFPLYTFRDPHDRRYGREWERNKFIIAAGGDARPCVFVRCAGRPGGGLLWEPPVTPPERATRTTIYHYVTLMVDVYADLGLVPTVEHLTGWLVRAGYANHGEAETWVRRSLKSLTRRKK